MSFLGSLLCLKSTRTYCKLFYSCAEFALLVCYRCSLKKRCCVGDWHVLRLLRVMIC